MKYTLGLSWVALVLLSGCGAGNEPMAILGDPSQSLGAAVGAVGPGLGMPLASNSVSSFGGYGAQGFQPYSTATPFIALQNTGYNALTSVLAPGTGIVVDVSNQSIAIYHNAHVISKVTGVLNIVQVGAFVTIGTPIGTALPVSASYANPIIKFYVYADGLPVCPLSYLNEAGRLQLKNDISYVVSAGYTGSGDPCI